MEYLLGMDAGGTKTLCALSDLSGMVVGVGLSGCGNFQTTGKRDSAEQLGLSIKRAIRSAKIQQNRVAAAFYGVSGADREKDFATVRELLAPINPAPRMFLENDTCIALRAGTERGIGLGLISGTGVNAIGFNEQGKRVQVGGWGTPYLGDFGTAHDIAACAFARAQQGRDGRGPATLLYERLTRALEIDDLVDICEWGYFDNIRPLDIASFAPLVFETARDGDRVAIEILEKAGREIARAGLAVLRALFRPETRIPVVLAGSVFQKGSHPAMTQALETELRMEFPFVHFRVLKEPPVVGALLCAADRHFEHGLPPDFRANLVASLRGHATAWQDPTSASREA